MRSIRPPERTVEGPSTVPSFEERYLQRTENVKVGFWFAGGCAWNRVARESFERSFYLSVACAKVLVKDTERKSRFRVCRGLRVQLGRDAQPLSLLDAAAAVVAHLVTWWSCGSEMFTTA